MDNDNDTDVGAEYELVCDYNPLTREVKFCYYNAETEEQTEELPTELQKFIDETVHTEWIGHLSTSYLPFRQFYTHKATNISVWHEPQCFTKLRDEYNDKADDWAIRSKKLEMAPHLQAIFFDFDNQVVLSDNATAIDKFQYELLQSNKQKYCLSNGKVSPNFVCFYRNNITQQCLFEIPSILDQFQLKSESHRDWSPQLSGNIDKFFYVHGATNVCLWDMPLVYRLNREKHLQTATKDDWRIFINSEHKKPLYLHTKSKITQFELPAALHAAEKKIPATAWGSGINPSTRLPYYFNKENNLTLWHLPTSLQEIKREFNKKRSDEDQNALAEKRKVKDMDYSYWEVQYVTFQSRQPTPGEEPPNEEYITYYKHRYTQECALDLPPSTLAFIKTTKKSDWVKVNILNTTIFYYEHNTKVEKDPYNLFPSIEQMTPNGQRPTSAQQSNSSEGICVWTSPLDIITHHAYVAKQTEAQLLVQNHSSNDDDITLDPEDDVDNWLIYYDPNATNPTHAETLAAMVKAKQRKTSTSLSHSVEEGQEEDDDDLGGLQRTSGGGFGGGGGGYDDDDDDSDFGGGLVSSNGGSGLGDLISSTTFQLQGLRLGSLDTLAKISPQSQTKTLALTAPRTELEEGVEIGTTTDQQQRRPSFSTFSFSTTQRHLMLTARGQQYYFNTITKRIQPDLPTCFDLFQANLDPSNNTPNDWESAVGKLSPFPFYRYKHKRSLVMWHEPICVRNYRMNDYNIKEAEDLSATVQDWVIRFVGETNSAYYKNNKTLWYQTTIPQALQEYQIHKKNIREWESTMSQTCVGVVVYSHITPRGDTGCNLLQMPDCVKEKLNQPDPSCSTNQFHVSAIDHRFNTAGTTFQENALNWALQYDSVSNTTYYRNLETLYLSTNIPKPLYHLGTSRLSTHTDWKQTIVYFDADGDVMTTKQKQEIDEQIAANPTNNKKQPKLYTEKTCYEYRIQGTNKVIRTFHRPHVLRDYLRQTENTFDWMLIRSTDNSHFLYKNKQTNELTSDLPDSISKWLNDDKEALKPELWVGCVDTTLKQSYYKHKPTNIMVSNLHEPKCLSELRNQPYKLEEELSQWTIFANKIDNRCYYQNKVTKQCVIGSIPKILLEWSCTTKKNEWNFLESSGAINKGYWYHLRTGTRMWEQPDFIDIGAILDPQ